MRYITPPSTHYTHTLVQTSPAPDIRKPLSRGAGIWPAKHHTHRFIVSYEGFIKRYNLGPPGAWPCRAQLLQPIAVFIRDVSHVYRVIYNSRTYTTRKVLPNRFFKLPFLSVRCIIALARGERRHDLENKFNIRRETFNGAFMGYNLNVRIFLY